MIQDDAFKVLTMGKNVFLTGAAGSGKTHLLNSYIEWLRIRGIEPAITASTGIAATHIGGQTIHSWSGIGIKNNLSEYDLDYIAQNERLVKRFRSTQVLIIDEISMLSAETLTMVDQSIQAGLQTHEPFGGMQVIFCGDFFQLPPVVRGRGDVNFAFSSNVWKELSLHVCYLHEQFRQNDADLLGLLESIRNGSISKDMHAQVQKRVGLSPPENIPHLYTHNVDVDRLNNERLAELKGSPHLFHMSSKGSKRRVETLKKGLLVPETLTLKKDATVMFVKNHLHGDYVNGTLGTITGFNGKHPVVKTHDGFTLEVEQESWSIEDGDKVLAEVTQMPLRLAWAVTIHKSQGLTLDAAHINLAKTFVPGQGYVALSRIRSFDGLYLEGISDMAYARHPSVASANTAFNNASERIERRLAKTDKGRIADISKEFIFNSGGHEPDPNRPKGKVKKKVKLTTYEKTRNLLLEGGNITDIASERGITEDTVTAHIEKLLTEHKIQRDDIEHLRTEEDNLADAYEEIARAFAELEKWGLTPAHKKLKEKYSYKELRFARLFLRPWGREE